MASENRHHKLWEIRRGLDIRWCGRLCRAEEAQPPKQARGRSSKAQHVEKVTDEAQEIWSRIEEWAQASVLDSAPDPAKTGEAREAQLRKLWKL